MNYDNAAVIILDNRKKVDALEAQIKAINAETAKLGEWFTLQAQEQGLVTVPTLHGTAYWSTHNSASVAAKEPFFDFIKETGNFDLVQARANVSAVKSYIDGHGEAPPGITFSTVKLFKFREGKVE